MVDSPDFAEKIAVIESKSYKVRVRLNGKETMYCARDILTACDIKIPDKWIKRRSEKYPSRFTAIKLDYPIMTGVGYRVIAMFFVNERVVKNILKDTPCNNDTKKWILNEVLNYRIEPPADPAPVAVPDLVRSVPDFTIGQRIDAILFELLELKKFLADSAGAVRLGP